MRFHRAALILLAACQASESGPAPVPGTTVQMGFDRAAGFYAAPFPSDDLVVGGHVDLARFPNPTNVSLVSQARDLLIRDADGFALTGGVFFQLSGAIDATALPDAAASLGAKAPVFLIGVGAGPDHLRRQPVDVSFAVDGGPFGAPNLLTLLPLQGAPLRPNTLYAAVVLRTLGDAAGKPLDVSAGMAALAAGTRPPGLPDAAYASYQQALTALAAAGVKATDIAGLAAFTTGDPTAGLARFRDDILAQPAPAPAAPWQRKEVFDDYCVYATTIAMPDYQSGTPPFANQGGDWLVDGAGRPILQRSEEANLVVTVPRRPLPDDGFPTVVFVRAGGGGDRPLVDRGVQAKTGGDALVPGTGPARWIAKAGFAGVSVDGPLGGRRNPTGGDENYLLWNITHGAALRDNIRQSALELILMAHLVPTWDLDTSDCPGGPAHLRFDAGRMAIMGHSNGSTIAPLALALEPRYRAAVLSGCGGSWIENVLYKKLPIAVRDFAEILLRYDPGTLQAGDPVLTLVQWAAEPADPQVYSRRVLREPADGEEPRHVLMFQGIVDHYILPRIANAMSLSLGLDLAGPTFDTLAVPDLADQTPLETVLAMSGGHQIALPVSANRPGTTAVVVQHPGDGIEDGHEVMFQTEAPKHQYRCFLQSFARGVPAVVPDGAADADCP